MRRSARLLRRSKKESRYEGGGDRKVGRLLSRSLKGAVEEIEE